MARRVSKTNLALALFVLLLLLSIYALFDMPTRYHPSYAIYAEKLDSKPAEYFAFPNPDKYVLEAIANQHSSTFNSLGYTQLDELRDNYGTSNIEYNGSYYQTAMLYGDNFPPAGLPLMILAGIAISAISILIIGLFKITKYLSIRNKASFLAKNKE